MAGIQPITGFFTRRVDNRTDAEKLAERQVAERQLNGSTSRMAARRDARRRARTCRDLQLHEPTNYTVGGPVGRRGRSLGAPAIVSNSAGSCAAPK